MTSLHHEELYRGRPTLDRLGSCRIVVCGGGALGANLAESLVRCGARELAVIDRDRVEERNLSTQPYRRTDVGSFKAKILAADLYRATGAAVRAHAVELDEDNADQLLANAELVVDMFDNSVARGLVSERCTRDGRPALHAGLAEEYSEVIWNEHYSVPSDAQDDICDYPLARNLVTLTVAIACEVILRWIATGERESYTLTLRDLRVQPYPP